MTIPVTDPEAAAGSAAPAEERGEWTRLDPASKRERLLTDAMEVFARDGLDAPMSVVADAAGAGVASVYRLFPSKRELLAALVSRRMDQIAAAAREAHAQPGDRWSALTGMLRSLVNTQRADYLIGEARAEGRLRADATTLDLRLLFAATRAARRVEPEQWPRMLELMIDALDSQRAD